MSRSTSTVLASLSTCIGGSYSPTGVHTIYTALIIQPIRQSQLRSLDFMINRLFMKLFKTNDIRLVHLCQDLFHFHLPSELLQQRSKKLRRK